MRNLQDNQLDQVSGAATFDYTASLSFASRSGVFVEDDYIIKWRGMARRASKAAGRGNAKRSAKLYGMFRTEHERVTSEFFALPSSDQVGDAGYTLVVKAEIMEAYANIPGETPSSYLTQTSGPSLKAGRFAE